MKERGRVPIEYIVRAGVPTDTIVRGYRAGEVAFECRAYETRSDSQKALYDRLVLSIFHHGISDPIIGWVDPSGQMHALIGMRRHEIAERMGIPTVVVAEIQEDVQKWKAIDVNRLNRMKKALGQKDY